VSEVSAAPESELSTPVQREERHGAMFELLAYLVQPSDDNGLRSPSRLMVDKLTTAPKRSVAGFTVSLGF
jgi:hypothetical protein